MVVLLAARNLLLGRCLFLLLLLLAPCQHLSVRALAVVVAVGVAVSVPSPVPRCLHSSCSLAAGVGGCGHVLAFGVFLMSSNWALRIFTVPGTTCQVFSSCCCSCWVASS